MWRVAADTGGTFTDCHALAPDGRELRCKVLSTGALRARICQVPNGSGLRLEDAWKMPRGFFVGFEVVLPLCPGRRFRVVNSSSDEGLGLMLKFDAVMPHGHEPGMMVELTTDEEAPILGARLLTGTSPGSAFPSMQFRLATTRATNALLERKGSPVALFITRGFGDLLLIGDQRRADLFALSYAPRPIFHAAVCEVRERIDAQGRVLNALDEIHLRAEAVALFQSGIRHAAIALLHSHAHPVHERRVTEILREAGFDHITLSSEIAPFTKILPRAQSAVANAYLTAPVASFLDHIALSLHSSFVIRHSSFHVLTSAGGLESHTSIRPKDMLLSGPAGGVIGAANAAARLGITRIISFDMGGTSTDVARIDGRPGYRFTQNVAGMSLLAPCVAIETVAAGGGSICQWTPGGLAVGPESAGSSPGPACYGKDGPLTITDVNLLLGRFDATKAPIPLAVEPAQARLDELRARIEKETGKSVAVRELLEGFLRLAIERMADAIRRISVSEGYDPADYALLAFGGAGPQHACALAECLGIRTVLVPGNAGILSAVGLQEALPEHFAERQILRVLEEVLPLLEAMISELANEAREKLEGIFGKPLLLAELRLRGQDVPMQIAFENAADLPRLYRESYERLFGYTPPANRIIELVSLRVSVRSGTRQSSEIIGTIANSATGPALIQDEFSTLVIDAGWGGEEITGFGWKLSPSSIQQQASSIAFPRDIFRHRLHSIVEEMGALLRRTAISTNIRERLDFSCALLDPAGHLVTSAPHIPVHLGALGVCVRETVKRLTPKPGDTLITNHPAYGGSHLPDITLITPVFDDTARLLGYIANRAHHAEIGGITPGSMPANATRLIEEGVVIAPRHLIKEGRPCFDEIEALFTTAPHPTRNLADNLADLHAQLAANLLGVERLRALAGKDYREMMTGILADSARVMRERISTIDDCAATEHLDDGSCISVVIRKSLSQKLTLDFTGTAPTHAGNLNATTAIVQSVMLYVLRLMLREDLPLNEGLLDPIEIISPPSLLNPVFTGDAATDPAVVGGNVEVSQRLADTLIKALRLQACSQGTMNNLLFGDATFGYYETIAGGSGAGAGHDGASALHTHMTNTAITDPEIIEQRYPVLLREFSIRKNSGGSGKWRGGDGVVREFEFRAPLTVSLLTQHRVCAPFGIEGGGDGATGIQTLHSRGRETKLSSSCSIEAVPGDRLRIETPGGGGCGPAVAAGTLCGLKHGRV